MQEVSATNTNKRLETRSTHAGGPAFDIKSTSFIDGIPKLNKHGLEISDL